LTKKQEIKLNPSVRLKADNAIDQQSFSLTSNLT